LANPTKISSPLNTAIIIICYVFYEHSLIFLIMNY